MTSATIDQIAPSPVYLADHKTLEAKPVRNLVLLGLWPFMLGFVRRCNEAGIAIHLIRIADQPLKEPRKAPWLASNEGTIFRNEIGTQAALERILRFARTVDADAICTVEEFALLWLDRHRDQFEPECRLMTPSTESLEQLRDKSKQISLARRAGFAVLDSWLLHSAADVAAIPDSAFPVCLRPARLNAIRAQFKAKRLDTREQLSAFLASLKEKGSTLIAQPYCLGPNIVLHAARSISGKIEAMDSFRAYRKYDCLALSLERYALSGEIMDAARRFADLAGIYGPFHFDLLQSAETGEVFFLEINYRMGGTTAKVEGLGYDEPMLALSSFGLVPPRCPKPLVSKSRVTSKRTLVSQLASVRKKAPRHMDFPQASRARTVLSNLREIATVPDPLISLRDLRGTWLYLARGMNM